MDRGFLFIPGNHRCLLLLTVIYLGAPFACRLLVHLWNHVETDLEGTQMDIARNHFYRRLPLWLWIALLVAASYTSPLAALQLSPNVPSQDARNTDIRTVDTHMPLPEFSNLQAWEQRKKFLRNQILVSAGLSPMPGKTPLNAQIFGKIEEKAYTIEKVLIETLPGFYLGGNLYRPRNGRAKHPGILNPQGHWQYGRLENQPLYSAPSLGISLARQGYIVFAYDMVGYNDTIQLPHRFGNAKQRLWSFGPLGLQLWDSIRSLDFLASLEDVDTTRLGITGASGGGTQAFLLTAVDDRIQFASPVNMVSAIMQGGDLCENAPGLRLDTSNVEIAAMFAPRPMLLVSATGDWTRNVPKEEYPAIRRIYDLYGKGDKVEVVQIDQVHNFNQLSREAVYRFFAKENPGLSDSRELTEHDITVPMVQEMTVLSNRTLPANALDSDGVFHLWKDITQAQNSQMQDPAFLRDRLQQTLTVETSRDVVAKVDGQSIVLSLPAKKDRVPGVWIPGKGRTAIIVDPNGSASALKTELVRRLQKDGRPILLLDVFQTGAAKSPREGDISNSPAPKLPDDDDEAHANAAAGYPKFLTFNETADAARVQDIVTALAYSGKTSRDIDLFASGDAALWSIFAAAVSPVPVSLHLENVPDLKSDADYIAHFNVPGVLRAGGITAAEKLVHDR
jgi:dienelactone hydrolase